MNEHEDLIGRLRAFGRRPVSPDISAGHLAAMEASAGSATAGAPRHRLRIVAAFAVGLVAGTSGLATAGALPDGAQEVAHRTLGAVGVNVPHGDRYQGPECGGVVKNHGQYVRSQPKENRAEAARSRCGKPVQAGSGDDAADPSAGTGAGCQGAPPWAGKGKPDPAAKAARKQACGGDDDGDEKSEGSSPAAGGQPGASVVPETPSTTTPSEPTTSTSEPTTATSTPTSDATTTSTSTPPATTPSVTTPSTAGSGGGTTSTSGAGSPSAGQGS
jgi:hypothetical protein